MTAWVVLTVLAASSGAVAASDALEELERRARAAAREVVAEPDRFEPESVRIAGEIAPTDTGFELVAVDGPGQSGLVRVSFETSGETGRRSIQATVRGRVMGEALVATRTIGRGETPAPTAIELRDTDLTRLRDEPLRDVGQLEGQVPVRTLGAGRVLTADLLEPIPLVFRNQAVTLQFVRPGLLVTASGTALADGAAGESITAVNVATGARVMALVQADGSLRVLHGLGNGRRR